MKVGDSAALTRSVTTGDVAAYAALTGAPTLDGLVPEPLIGALFSKLLGVDLPGQGTNYLKQQTMYYAPARIGETVEARVTITRLRPDKHLVDLETLCLSEDGRCIAAGRALVYAADTGLPFET